MARISKTTLNKSGESGRHCLVPDLRGSAFSYSPLNVVFVAFSTELWVCGLYYVEIGFLCVNFLESFYQKWVLNFVKGFFESIDMIIWLFFFSLLMWFILLIDLQILKNPCIPGINPTWSWCMILLMHCWIWFANILLKFFCLCSSVILACNFHFLRFLSFCYQNGGALIEWVWECSFLWFFGIVSEG